MSILGIRTCFAGCQFLCPKSKKCFQRCKQCILTLASRLYDAIGTSATRIICECSVGIWSLFLIFILIVFLFVPTLDSTFVTSCSHCLKCQHWSQKFVITWHQKLDQAFDSSFSRGLNAEKWHDLVSLVHSD